MNTSADDPTGWFEPLYRRVRDGKASAPWDRGGPHPLLLAWLDGRPDQRAVERAGRALVVGSGPGSDAALLAERGFRVTGFDVSPTAIDLARERFPGSGVEFEVADLFAPPSAWDSAFDLVVEIFTVQSMPPSVRAAATARITDFVAPGGTLLVITAIWPPPGTTDDSTARGDSPPWPLTREEIVAFAGDRLTSASLDQVSGPSGALCWLAVFTRPFTELINSAGSEPG